LSEEREPGGRSLNYQSKHIIRNWITCCRTSPGGALLLIRCPPRTGRTKLPRVMAGRTELNFCFRKNTDGLRAGWLIHCPGTIDSSTKSTGEKYFLSNTIDGMTSASYCHTSFQNDGRFRERGYTARATRIPFRIPISRPFRDFSPAVMVILSIRIKTITGCRTTTGWIYLSKKPKKKSGVKLFGLSVPTTRIPG